MAEAFFDILVTGRLCKVNRGAAMNTKLLNPKADTTPVMHNNKTYPGDVTNAELAAMKLSAKTCMKNNSIVLNEMLQEYEIEDDKLKLLKLNSSFMLKSENSQFYTRGILTRCPVETLPSSLCHNPEKHFSLIDHLPLSVACPTCWSVQRLGCAKRKTPKAVKRRSPLQKEKSGISSKLKITGPTAKTSEETVSEKLVKIKIEPQANNNVEDTKRNKSKEADAGAQTSEITHRIYTKTRPKSEKYAVKTTKFIDSKTSKSSTKTEDKKPIEIRTRTRTIIPVKFTSL